MLPSLRAGAFLAEWSALRERDFFQNSLAEDLNELPAATSTAVSILLAPYRLLLTKRSTSHSTPSTENGLMATG